MMKIENLVPQFNYPNSFCRCLAGIFVVGIGLFLGCDPVRTTQQHITISVFDVNGLPVPNATLNMKESWKSWSGDELNESEKIFYRDRWESEFVPVLKGKTGLDGFAMLGSKVTAMDDSTNDIESIISRDITGREFLVVVQSGGVQEEILLIAKPNSVGNGLAFTIKVEALPAPTRD